MKSSLALARTVTPRLDLIDLARAVIVIGSALALILADKPLPF